MKFLTVNMSLEVGLVQERIVALGKLVKSKRPEFIALQNVTVEMIKNLKRTPWGSRYESVYPPTTYESRGKPTLAILSTYPPHNHISLPYHDTTKNRMLLKGYYLMHDKQKKPHIISLCTTQLEVGKDMTETREIQMNEALLSLTGEEDCFVLGDFGLIDNIDGEVHLNGRWKDCWLSVGGNTPKDGETYVPASNPLIRDKTEAGRRPDRALYKTRRYKLESVEVIGKEPIDGVHVSSHFAVLATFNLLDPDSYLPREKSVDVACFFDRPQWSLSFK